MFEQTMVNEGARTSRPYTVSLSAVAQLMVAGGGLLFPLVFIEPLPKIPLKIPGPRSPITLIDPGPLRPVPRSARPGSVALNSRAPRFSAAFVAPRTVPATIALFDGPPVDYAPAGGDNGAGIPDGFSVFSGGGTGFVPPPPPTAPKAPVAVVKPPDPKPERVRVGGQVRQPVLVHEVRPVYPPLARQTRVQGIVRMEAVLASDGTIRELRLVGGHPLLTQAAFDAVRQWRYQPTLLNGEPVEVLLSVEVNFRLGN